MGKNGFSFYCTVVDAIGFLRSEVDRDKHVRLYSGYKADTCPVEVGIDDLKVEPANFELFVSRDSFVDCIVCEGAVGKRTIDNFNSEALAFTVLAKNDTLFNPSGIVFWTDGIKRIESTVVGIKKSAEFVKWAKGFAARARRHSRHLPLENSATSLFKRWAMPEAYDLITNEGLVARNDGAFPRRQVGEKSEEKTPDLPAR